MDSRKPKRGRYAAGLRAMARVAGLSAAFFIAFLPSANAGALPTPELICHNTVTYTNTTPGTADTCAISGLTANDMLWIVTNTETTVANSGVFKIYNSTDNIDLGITVTGNSTTGNGFRNTSNYLTRAPNTATKVSHATDGGMTITTAWTGSWNLAIHGNGDGTAGNVQYIQWAVYKISMTETLTDTSGYLENDGSGTLSWTTPAGGGGSTTTCITGSGTTWEPCQPFSGLDVIFVLGWLGCFAIFLGVAFWNTKKL